VASLLLVSMTIPIGIQPWTSMKKEPKGKILIMDDEKALAEVTAFMLHRMGWQVEITFNGGDAINLYSSQKDSGRPFDAVILDINVPGGMGGGEAIKKLLKIDPGIKAIVSSGQCHHPIMDDFRKYGFSGALSKPFDITDLTEELRKVMQRR
jgi:CheY-like chemotaxis protein